MKQKPLSYYEEVSEATKDDLLVSLTVHDIPACLLKEFIRKVAKRYYMGKTSDAIKHLMAKAVQEWQLE